MTHSMTGFAALKGHGEGVLTGYSWTWELRSVNGKGLDLRLRVPDWIDGLEALLRAEIGRMLHRGSVNLTLKVMREAGAEGQRVNPVALRAALAGLAEVETAAMSAGLTLRQASQADVLGMRGVLEQFAGDEDTTPLRAALMAEVPTLLTDFTTMRAAEGAALAQVIATQLDVIATLTAAAAREAHARRDQVAITLRENLARIIGNAEGVDEGRVAQELAILAVKADVTEELDRLAAHVDAARTLMSETGPVGRKLDFLMQEFNREANTLCSKAQAIALTRIGLDLKTVIDQMREQIQNVE